MVPQGLGDMAQQLMLRRNGSALSGDIKRLSSELSTGRVVDQGKRVQGDFSVVSHLTKMIRTSETAKANAEFSKIFLGAQQSALEIITRHTISHMTDYATFDQNPMPQAAKLLARSMNESFTDTIGALNTSFAGRSIFAGVDGDRPAVADAEAILQELVSIIPANADAAAVGQIIDDWFAVGGGFDNPGFSRGAITPQPLELLPGQTVAHDVTGRDPALRTTLAAFAKGAIVEAGVLAADPDQEIALLRPVFTMMKSAGDGLIQLSAKIGLQEARAARISSEAEAQNAASTIAKAEMLEADPYDTATKLEAAMAQLDRIYMLTARLSRLSLTEYLR